VPYAVTSTHLRAVVCDCWYRVSRLRTACGVQCARLTYQFSVHSIILKIFTNTFFYRKQAIQIQYDYIKIRWNVNIALLLCMPPTALIGNAFNYWVYSNLTICVSVLIIYSLTLHTATKLGTAEWTKCTKSVNRIRRRGEFGRRTE
jgi:undecaprenyl pyrophosphate phosphatase UppP